MAFSLFLLVLAAPALTAASYQNKFGSYDISFESDPNSHSTQRAQNPFDSLPPFLNQVSRQARREYMDIMNNESLTIVQMEQQLQSWAQKNKVLDAFNRYQQEQKMSYEALKTKVRQEIGNLPNVLQRLTQILEDKNQSVRMQRQAIQQLSRQYPDELTSLFFIAQMAARGVLQPSQNVTGSPSSSSPTTPPRFPTRFPGSSWSSSTTDRHPGFSSTATPTSFTTTTRRFPWINFPTRPF